MTGVRLHPAAATDIRHAVEWYESQWPGLGRIVLAELDRLIARLRIFPHAFPELRPGLRQAALGRLPFRIVYAVADQQITLIAVMHTRRDPDATRAELTGRIQL